MKPKRRKRAVAFGAMLALACLTAIPATSAAYMIKWYFTSAVGDPDQPDYGVVRIRLGLISLRLLDTGSSLASSRFMLVVTFNRGSMRPR